MAAKKERKRVLVPIELLERVLGYLKADLEASGGCDHSVGICACNQVNDMDTLNGLIGGDQFKYSGMFPEEKSKEASK